MTFYLSQTSSGQPLVIQIGDGFVASSLFDGNNPTYQAYLAWVAEGNTAEEWNPQG
jgi:hypothetical protein